MKMKTINENPYNNNNKEIFNELIRVEPKKMESINKLRKVDNIKEKKKKKKKKNKINKKSYIN